MDYRNNNANKVTELVSANEMKSLLQSKGFHSIILNSDKEVKDFINSSIPDKATVGLGNSITTCKLNIRNLLYAKGSIIYYSWNGSDEYNRSLDTFDSTIWPDYFITRLTALTLSGEMLMKDYSKLSALYEKFPPTILAFVGMNRVVERLNDCDSIRKYTVIKTCPASINFNIALLPFLIY